MGSRECQHCSSQTRHKALQNSTYNTWKLPPARACKTSTITQNVLEELPAHVCREVAETIRTVKQAILGDKDTVRASDMRELLVILTKELEQQGKARTEVMQLLYSLVDIQKLCYAAADDRTTTVYRLSNAVLKHHFMRKECFPGNPRNITNRRLWGQYIHTIRDHTPLLYRIAAISTLMAENEERHFSTFKRITKTSANYANPGHIITNILVRCHFNKNAGTTTNQDNKISQTAKLLSQLRTRIPISLLKKYPREAQTHCERVCDFLQPGRHGTDCLQDEVPMPLCKLWIYKYDGQTLSKKVTTPFLDTGYDFAKDKFPYMKKVATEKRKSTEGRQHVRTVKRRTRGNNVRTGSARAKQRRAPNSEMSVLLQAINGIARFPKLVYQGKTTACHPKLYFPEEWGIHHSESHWSNASTMGRYADKVLIPYVTAQREVLGVSEDQPALAIFDVFKAHRCPEHLAI
ncbi:hypothetical protein Bbelb_243310 [Branchiostoma belcheri]|nr:hypothetical protein Bbelb_243310 [Branchiostoma belcheri]